MNNPVPQVTSVAKKIFAAGNTKEQGNVLHPKRDWYIGIAVGCLIAPGVGGWSAYTYVDNRNNTISSVEVETVAPIYQASLIEEAQQVVSERAAAFAAVTQSSVVASSPVAVASTSPAIASTIPLEEAATATTSESQSSAESEVVTSNDIDTAEEVEISDDNSEENEDTSTEPVVPELSQ